MKRINILIRAVPEKEANQFRAIAKKRRMFQGDLLAEFIHTLK